MQIAFPYHFDRGGRTADASDPGHVHDLVEQVLFTVPGERVMRPTLGSGLAQLVFQPSSDELATAVQFLVQGNLQQWLGDVITVQSVDVQTADSALEVQVVYVIRATGDQVSDQFSMPQ
jgi:phage baseplate assembly protein W